MHICAISQRQHWLHNKNIIVIILVYIIDILHFLMLLVTKRVTKFPTQEVFFSYISRKKLNQLAFR